MDAVLENLYRIIPIVLAILWVLRRINRRRKSARKRVDRQAPARPESLVESLFSPFQKVIKQTEGAVTPPPLQPEEKIPRKNAKGTRNTAARNTQEGSSKSGFIKVPNSFEAPLAPSPQPHVWVHRAVDTPAASGPLERLESLPALPRALLWSFILEKPPSLREPHI